MSLTRSLARSRIARGFRVCWFARRGLHRASRGNGRAGKKSGKGVERQKERATEGGKSREREREREDRETAVERKKRPESGVAQSESSGERTAGRAMERWGGESGWTREEEDWRRPGNGRVGTWGGSVVRQRAVSRAGGWTGGIECGGGGGGVARRWRQ